ncbi:uncharacterized protein LOC62_02G003430 [Vanrija pseudolonga]|uniref:Purtative membrane protein n=1 Tax=Vanrija pseudolonga TaxID=143232 RepID=A0AAF1BGL1_9TREE|nr:purtative membrane protein [Vanrija pseudolonga]
MTDDTIEPTAQEHKPLSWLRLRSPVVQNLICSCVLAMTPGILLALTAMGAGGGKPNTVSFFNQTNVILYSVFTVSSILAGSAINMFGPRYCLAFGSTGYALYVGGLWYFSNTGREPFPLFTAAYLGVTAGFLWDASGYTSQAYAPERRKALFIAQQWSIICIGSAVGSAIGLSANYNKTKATGVGPAVYGAFIGIHLLAGIIALCFIVDPRTVRRNDGTYLAVFPHASLRDELRGMWETLHNPRVMMFMFAAFALDLWLPILGSWNSFTFSLRARTLNSMVFYLIQIPSAFFCNWLVSTDLVPSRRKRIAYALTWATVINVAAWAAWIQYLAKHNLDRHKPGPALDWTMGRAWAEPFGIYLVMGIMAPVLRNFCLYMCSIASNDPTKQARYNAVLHSMPQAGICVAFGVDSTKIRYLYEAAAWFGVTIASLVVAAIGVALYATETLYGAAGEENVIVPTVEAKTLGIDTHGEMVTIEAKDGAHVAVQGVDEKKV